MRQRDGFVFDHIQSLRCKDINDVRVPFSSSAVLGELLEEAVPEVSDTFATTALQVSQDFCLLAKHG